MYYQQSPNKHSKIALIFGILVIIVIIAILIYYFMKYREHPLTGLDKNDDEETGDILRIINTLDSDVKIKHGEMRSSLKPFARKNLPLIPKEKITATVGKNTFDITLSKSVDTLYVKPLEFGTNQNTSIGKIQNNSDEPLIFIDGKISYNVKPNHSYKNIPITKGDKWSVKRVHSNKIIDKIIVRNLRNEIIFDKNKLYIK